MPQLMAVCLRSFRITSLKNRNSVRLLSWAYNGRMYIFGGYIGTSKVHLGDLYEFDPTKCRWRLLTPFGDGPSPRRRHCTVLVNDRLFLFGGTM
ncbi:unnamed protein product [Anisakis simplex]|uniref:Kelch domain-containing protein 10 n=1 Tax=Anisakis simplex TaxID=6269 RepID=A0A0M3JNR3_ANISI|nr:unnamed protein product [Anisakis simplex]